MSMLSLIVKREYIARVRNKSFIIMTFLSPIILVGMIFLIAYLTQINSDTDRTILVVDEMGSLYEALENTPNTTYKNYSNLGIEAAKELAENGTYYGVIHIAPQGERSNFIFYSADTPPIALVEAIEKKLEKHLTDKQLVAKGVNPEFITQSKADIDLSIQNFTGDTSSKLSGWIKAGFGGAAGYLLMMFIIIYGNMVMRSVIEEKTNRIIEVIISSVKPFQLMLGKILGTTLAGITQFSIWVFLGVILLTIASLFLKIDTNAALDPQVQQLAEDPDKIALFVNEVTQLPLITLVISFLIYFIGGYFLYSSIYAAIGAAVDSETDTQQFMLPIIMPLMLAIYVGFFAVIENPHGTVATIFSIIPLTSPIVMLMRIPFDVPMWQLLLSIIILIGSFTLTVWFGAKIYRVGILMYGKKPTYKELFKWLKY